MATLGDAEEFGNLTAATEIAAGCSSPTRGIIGGGDNPADTNTIEYVSRFQLQVMQQILET